MWNHDVLDFSDRMAFSYFEKVWVEPCSPVVAFFLFKLYSRVCVKNDMCLFFQWWVKGSRVEKTWHISGPDCKLRLPFQTRFAYDMGSNDILEAIYELCMANVLLLLYWSIGFFRTFDLTWLFRQDGFFIFWKREPGHYFEQRWNKYGAVEEIHIWKLEQGNWIIPS